MRIKKFNELFDSEEMKDEFYSENPSAEIDLLTKNFGKYTKIDYSPNEKTIENLLTKIIGYKYPFISIFLDADREPNGIIETENFNICVRYDENEKYHAFILSDDRYMVIFSIRVNKDDYDVIVALYDIESPDDIKSFEENNITFDDLVDIIKNEYIPTIEEYGFEEVLSHNSISNLQRNN